MKFGPLRKNREKRAVQILRRFFPIWGALAGALLFLGIKNKNAAHFFEARKRRKLVGIAFFSIFGVLGYKFLHLNLFAIDPSIQRSGVGSKMIRKVENYARRRQQNYLLLTTDPSRRSSQKFYKKHGFKKILGFWFWKKIK